MGEIGLEALTDKGVAGALDQWTSAIMSDLGFPFGPARKSLNLFLRDLAYNNWMRERFQLATVEAELEVPLDGIVMSKIRENGWPQLAETSVVSLTSAASTRYQAAADEIAARFGTLRVHLDVEWWSGGNIALA